MLSLLSRQIAARPCLTIPTDGSRSRARPALLHPILLYPAHCPMRNWSAVKVSSPPEMIR